MIVSYEDVLTENSSADVGTVQVQGWLVVERGRTFVEFEATTKFAENVLPVARMRNVDANGYNRLYD